MTNFTAPFNLFGPWDTQTTVMSVAASGTATFAAVSGLTFSGTQVFQGVVSAQSNVFVDGTFKSSGAATFAADVQASSSATFQNRVQVGDAGQRGTALVVQRVTLLPSNSAGAPALVVLPNPSDILDFRVDVENAFETAAGATATNVELSVAGGANTLAVMVVSASTTPYGSDRANVTTFTGSQMRNVTATVQAHVSSQAQGSALTVGQAMLSIFYIPVN